MDKNEVVNLVLRKVEQSVDKILRGEISSEGARSEILQFIIQKCVGDSMPVSIKGKIYDIPGVGEVRLYPISKLSEAFKEAGIPRDPQTIRSWIKKGILPRSMFQVGNKKPHGLYSEHHIKTIVSVAKECGIKQGTSFRESNFQEKVWDAIEDLNEIFIWRK